MMEMHRRKRIEIIVEQSMLARVIEVIEQAGASGYTVVPTLAGKGRHGIRRDADVIGVFRNVLVIVVTNAEIAGKLVERAGALSRDVVQILLVSDVDVLRGEHF